MDFKHTFNSSFEFLKKNKIVAVPVILSLVVPILIFIIYIFSSGWNDLFISYTDLLREYDEGKRTAIIESKNFSSVNYLAESAGYVAKRGPYEEGLEDFLEEKGFYKEFADSFDLSNVAVLVTILFIAILAWLYFSCILYVMILIGMKKKTITYADAIKATNRFFLRYLLVDFFTILIIVVPIILSIILVFIPAFLLEHLALKALILIILIFAWIIGIIVYAVFMGVKLLLALPILFFENETVFKSIKRSFFMSKNNFKTLLIVFGIIYGIQSISQSIGITPFFDSIYNLLIATSIAKIIVLIAVLALFLVAGSFISAFESVFLLQSYVDFKKGNIKMKTR